MQRIYVSSTSTDLAKHRGLVVQMLESWGFVIVSMEGYGSDPRPPVEKCLEDVASADAYVGIFGFWYGTLAKDGLSITELEYRMAREKNIPTYLFLVPDKALDEGRWPAKLVERGAASGKMEHLRAEVIGNHMAQPFSDETELLGKVKLTFRDKAPRNVPTKPPGRTSSNSADGALGITLDGLRNASLRASDDYIDRMERERVYLPQLYAPRTELEAHLESFLNARCTKTGMLIVGASGIGKTNTLCHIVRDWRDDRLGPDIVLLLGGSTLPGGGIPLRDVILDRLDVSSASYSTLLAELQAQGRRANTQLVVVVDGIDKHPQPHELFKQLDQLIVQSETASGVKFILSVGEAGFAAIRKGGFAPALRAYYTVSIEEGARKKETCEILLGPMTEKELPEAYDRYRREPGLAPTNAFTELTDEVKSAIRHPLLLKIVMEIFNGRRIPPRVLNAEVLREYYGKKVSCSDRRVFFVNQLVGFFYRSRVVAARFEALAEVETLGRDLLHSASDSPYTELLDEQVLAEQLNRVSSILPPQKFVTFTYDRLLDYALLVWLAGQQTPLIETIRTVSHDAPGYLPLRGALTTLLHAKIDDKDFDGATEIFRTGNPDVMRQVALDLLMELEQSAPAEGAPAASMLGCFIDAMLNNGPEWFQPVLFEFGERLQRHGLYRRAGFIFDHTLRLVRAKADRVGEHVILEALGCIHFCLGDRRVARNFLEQALAIIESLLVSDGGPSTRCAQASALLNLAEIFHRDGEIPHAIELVQRAREIFESVQDRPGLAAATHLSGVLERRELRSANARRHHLDAISIHQQLGDKKGIAQDHCCLGLTYLVDGSWTEAMRELEQSLRIGEEAGDKAGLAYTWNCLGEAYRWEGSNLAKAMEAYERSLQLYEEMERERDIHMAVSNLGATHLFAGCPREAIPFLERAAALQQKESGENNIQGEPETLAWLSASALGIGDLARARRVSDAAVAILEKLRFGEEDVQLVNWYRHQILTAQGDEAGAMEALRRAHEDVMKQFHAVQDPGVRAGFIENFRLRREIVHAWESLPTHDGPSPAH